MNENREKEVSRIDELIERGNKMVLQFQEGGMDNQEILDIFVKFASEAEAKKETLEGYIEEMIKERGVIISLFEKIGRWNQDKSVDVSFYVQELVKDFLNLKIKEKK